ncbi:unnamed protein product [Phytophthora fragariaefolia]|uniref:Transcription initiation factor TFIID subunit 8 n=1 Tax=Phytophthora fragariaefolia TaxID=1490495 RepID=A0A9W7CRP7_9STRA|nr:unnamed protein product [Phytophthora fragariaefolia]
MTFASFPSKLTRRELAPHIQRIGAASKDVAELAGRTQPNATDVAQALQDLEPAPVEIKDLVKTLETAKRPFPRDVPAFPARKRDISGNTIEQAKIGRREGLPPHVPSFLPPLPNRHTYSSESRLVVEREQDTKRTRLELLSEKAQVRQSLHGLQTAAAKKPAVIVHQPTWNAFQGSTGDNATENPFVQAPIVSPVTKVCDFCGVLLMNCPIDGFPGYSAFVKGIFTGSDRDFAPNVDREKAQSKNQLDNNVTIPKLSK